MHQRGMTGSNDDRYVEAMKDPRKKFDDTNPGFAFTCFILINRCASKPINLMNKTNIRSNFN